MGASGWRELKDKNWICTHRFADFALDKTSRSDRRRWMYSDSHLPGLFKVWRVQAVSSLEVHKEQQFPVILSTLTLSVNLSK